MTLPEPYYSRDGVAIHVGDVRDVLDGLPERSVHCCVTSPPYWGLRDYGVAGQIGQEKTPEEYVATMVEVFRGVRRVLHDSGTVWCNLGDSMHNKQMQMIPWRVAIALQDDGWYVRSVICWAKKSCMPESVTDRPTNSWEPIFLLSKRAKYFYDAEAVKDPAETAGTDQSFTRPSRAARSLYRNPSGNELNGNTVNYSTRNQRNVWHLGPEPYAEAHFATFPSEIPRRAILAGTSEEGCCPKCLEPWVRVVERTVGDNTSWMGRSPKNEAMQGKPGGGVRGKTLNKGSKEDYYANQPKQTTTGWQPGCKCDAGNPIKCTVADIFFGSGTTGVVAQELHVNCIGIELNPEYAELARDRFRQGVLNYGGNE